MVSPRATPPSDDAEEAQMRERPHDGPPPRAYPVPGARPPHPDGDRVPGPAPQERPARPDGPAPTRRQYAYGLTVALLVLVLLVVGVLR
ncbi:hypothetical protein O7606_09655 [Micromonospora sp. WMMD882]|uniref:hypothetical protein n=1 Tax=Micromonospora sp. WMMD882 TaxID=3015151 RepID=UPI00248B9209|nr:hypothetical protein [Micromonospora sp. WMMD882]WBB81598.1 hypothetical protein O7606_09655 [Micromonospora sp. WMMD882]